MAILVLLGGLLFALAAGGAGAFFDLPVWVCLGLGVLGGSLGTGALVSVVMLRAVWQEISEEPWQDRRNAPLPDRRKQPWQRRPWQERRKAPWQDRRKGPRQDMRAGDRATPEGPFLMGR